MKVYWKQSQALDSNKQYVLLPPHDQPETLDLASRERINEEVKQVLYDERFLV